LSTRYRGRCTPGSTAPAARRRPPVLHPPDDERVGPGGHERRAPPRRARAGARPHAAMILSYLGREKAAAHVPDPARSRAHGVTNSRPSREVCSPPPSGENVALGRCGVGRRSPRPAFPGESFGARGMALVVIGEPSVDNIGQSHALCLMGSGKRPPSRKRRWRVRRTMGTVVQRRRAPCRTTVHSWRRPRSQSRPRPRRPVVFRSSTFNRLSQVRS